MNKTYWTMLIDGKFTLASFLTEKQGISFTEAQDICDLFNAAVKSPILDIEKYLNAARAIIEDYRLIKAK